MEQLIGPLLLAWVGSALWGMAKIASKGYLSGLTWNVGCLMFIFVGWWSIPILLALGPIWLLIAAGLEQKQVCPHCRNLISGRASRCSFCQGTVTPAIGEELR